MGGVGERVMEDVERRGRADLELERRLARGVEDVNGEAVVLAVPRSETLIPLLSRLISSSKIVPFVMSVVGVIVRLLGSSVDEKNAMAGPSRHDSHADERSVTVVTLVSRSSGSVHSDPDEPSGDHEVSRRTSDDDRGRVSRLRVDAGNAPAGRVRARPSPPSATPSGRAPTGYVPTGRASLAGSARRPGPRGPDVLVGTAIPRTGGSPSDHWGSTSTRKTRFAGGRGGGGGGARVSARRSRQRSDLPRSPDRVTRRRERDLTEDGPSDSTLRPRMLDPEPDGVPRRRLARPARERRPLPHRPPRESRRRRRCRTPGAGRKHPDSLLRPDVDLGDRQLSGVEHPDRPAATYHRRRCRADRDALDEAVVGRIEDCSTHLLDARQQTLRAAIDWSYRLLGPEERRVDRSRPSSPAAARSRPRKALQAPISTRSSRSSTSALAPSRRERRPPPLNA